MTQSLKFTLLLSMTFASLSIQAQPVANGAQRQIEEIIVSATKRDESLQDVPVAVSVVSGDMVKDVQMDNGTDIARFSPNVNVSYFGLPDQPKFSLRGAATTDFSLNTSSATGVLVDGVFLAASYFGGPLLFDIERIEALRGPQGTLFGKNTTGGAIQFITRKPSFGWGGYVDASVGDLGYSHVDGAVDVPLVEDRLAARLAFTYSKSDGFWKNENPTGHDLGDIDNRAARLSFAYQDENWDGTLRVFSSRSTPRAAGVIVEGTGPGNTNALGTNPRISPITGKSYNRHEGYWNRSGDIDVKTDGGYFTANVNLDQYTLTSVTSYVTGSFLNLVDADGSIDDLLHIDFYAESDEIQQDLRLTSNFSGPFNYIVGLYYFDEQSDIPTTTRLFEAIPRDFAPPSLAPTPNSVTTHYQQERESYAAYFNGSYNFTDALALDVGLRWTHDQGDLTDFTSTGLYINALVPNVTVPFILDDPANDMDYTDSAVTGKIGLDYTLADNSLLYGHYSRGYRSSAFDGTALFSANQLSTADPEYIDTIEFGYKTELADNRVRLNTAVFYSLYNDMQFLNATAPNESEIVNNDAKMYGVEIEAAALVGEHLMLTTGLGYLQGEYVDAFINDSTAGYTLTDISGNDLIEAPDINFSMAADYDLLLGDATTRFHIDANYVAKEYYDAFNTESVATDGYWNANARVSYIPGDGHLQLTLWVKNLTDNDEYVGRINAATFMGVFGIAPQPRRYGAEASWRF